MADRQPHPRARRDRDHRRDSALRTAAAKSAGTDPGIRTRASPSSTAIAGAAQGGAPFGSGFPPARSEPARPCKGQIDGAPARRAAPAVTGKSGPQKHQPGAPPRNHSARRKTLADNRRFLIRAPPTRRSGPAITSNLHRTAACTAASIPIRTAAKPAYPPSPYKPLVSGFQLPTWSVCEFGACHDVGEA